MRLLFIVIISCFLWIDLTLSVNNTYKAAVVLKNEVGTEKLYVSYIKYAAKSNVDILVLPSPDLETSTEAAYNYDESIKTLSDAAKQHSLYVIAHLMERIKCQKVDVAVRTNLVFGRDGSILSSYRKPVYNLPNCTNNDSGLQTFTTDFGVTFGPLMEEDLVLQNVETMKVKNFVAIGEFAMDIPFLSASRFSSSWAYVTDANLISSAGIFSGKAGSVGVCSNNNNIAVATLDKDGRSDDIITPPVVRPSKIQTFPEEDLSQYIIRPLNLETSVRGHKETVCHGRFCCDFDVKTRFVGSPQNDLSYGLAAYNGLRRLGASQNIGAQTCAVVACAGLYKRTCSIGFSNDTKVHFDELSVSANFTSSSSAQFPIIVSADSSKFKFDRHSVKNHQKVTLKVENTKNVWSFGIFGRDYDMDFEKSFLNVNNSEGLTSDIYDYLHSEEMVEFFDYLWIRLRILFVVVSIYFLEMM